MRRSTLFTAGSLALAACVATTAHAQTMRASCDNRQGTSFADVVDSNDPNQSGYNIDPSEIYRSFNAISFPNNASNGTSSASASLTVNSRFVGANPGTSTLGFIMNNTVTATATRGTLAVQAFANDTSAVCLDVSGASAASPMRIRLNGQITTSAGATGRLRLQNPSNGDIINITAGSINQVFNLTTNGTYRFTGSSDTGNLQPTSGSITRTATVRAAVVCMSDVNGSGDVTVQDIFDFLAFYFAGNLAADANASGAISVQDIFDFLAAYFRGC